MSIAIQKDTCMPFGISKEIDENYSHSKANHAEQTEKEQALRRAEEVKEANKETNDGRVSGRTPKLYDVYIRGEKSEEKPAGLYRIGQDENGERKIFFDDLGKVAHVDEDEQRKAKADNPEKSEEKCVGNTDKVDREIEKLKEKKRQLEQQIQSASGDEEKVKELEKKLAQVEGELRRKDNDAYRRQHSSFSG